MLFTEALFSYRHNDREGSIKVGVVVVPKKVTVLNDVFKKRVFFFKI